MLGAGTALAGEGSLSWLPPSCQLERGSDTELNSFLGDEAEATLEMWWNKTEAWVPEDR